MRQTQKHKKPKPLTLSWQGFTLAELLISLLILAEIATFAIPKILVTQQHARYNAIGKEAAGMIGAATQAYQLEHGAFQETDTAEVLTPYFNYVSIDTTSTVDNFWYNSCDGESFLSPCYRLHNGALLFISRFWTFQDNTEPSLVGIDVDGQENGERVLWFVLFPNGRLTTLGNLNNDGYYDPTWFDWSQGLTDNQGGQG